MSMGAQMKVIEVALRANVSQYTAGLGLAAAQTKAFGRDVNTLGREITGAGATGRQQLNELSAGAAVVGAGMLAGFGVAAGAAMNFNAQISEVGAVTGATGDQLDMLRTQALAAGQATVFSATEAAAAQVELAKAGVSTADIMGGALTGSLNLAAAGGIGVARSAEIGAQAMNVWSLNGSDMAHIADVLAAGANKSSTDVDLLGQSIAQSGLVAAQSKVSFEETVGVLSMFSDNALLGSDAGTSLKTMLQRLTPQSAEAAEEMDRLGLSFYDANGNFVGMADVAEQLRTRLGGLSDAQRNTALQVLFGSDAVRAAAILMKEGGAGVEEYTALVNDSGYAAELAAQKTDNLKGDIEQLGGAIETALINGGTQANGVLRWMTQSATLMVNVVANMPAPLAAAGMGITAITGGLLLAGGAITTVLPRYTAMMRSLMGMGTLGPHVATALSMVTRAAVAGGIAMMGLVAAYAIWESKRSTSRDAGRSIIESAVGDTKTMDEAKTSINNIINEVAKLDGQLAESSNWAFWDADKRADMLDMRNQLATTGTAMQAMYHQAESIATATGGSADAVYVWLESQRAAGTVYASNAQAYSAYMSAVAAGETTVVTAAMQADDQRAKMLDLQGTFLGVIDAGYGYQQALAAIGDAQLAAARAGRAVGDAQQSYADSLRGVAAAQQRYEDSFRGVADAQERYEDSLRGVADAQRAVTAAQQALDRALAGPSASDEVSLESARIRLEEARRTMTAGDFDDDLDARRAAVELRQAEIDLARIEAEIAGRPAEAAAELADAQGRLTDAHESVEDAAYGVEQANRAVEDAAYGVEQANRAVADASWAVSDAQMAAAAAAQGVASAQDGAVRAAIDLRNKQMDLQAAMRDETGASRDLLNELLFLQGAYPNLAGSIQPYIDKLRVLLALRAASTSTVTQLAGGESYMDDTGVLRRKAAGGPVVGGGTYLVGENGPEVLTTLRDGIVFPNHDPRTQRILTGGGAASGGHQVVSQTVVRQFDITIRMDNYLGDKREAARVIREEIRTLEKSTSGQD